MTSFMQQGNRASQPCCNLMMWLPGRVNISFQALIVQVVFETAWPASCMSPAALDMHHMLLLPAMIQNGAIPVGSDSHQF